MQYMPDENHIAQRWSYFHDRPTTMDYIFSGAEELLNDFINWGRESPYFNKLSVSPVSYLLFMNIGEFNYTSGSVKEQFRISITYPLVADWSHFSNSPEGRPAIEDRNRALGNRVSGRVLGLTTECPYCRMRTRWVFFVDRGWQFTLWT